MARSMKDRGEAFRTRIVIRGRDNTTWTEFEGPYATVGAAKSRATWAERRYKERLVEVVVEKAATNWEPAS